MKKIHSHFLDTIYYIISLIAQCFFMKTFLIVWIGIYILITHYSHTNEINVITNAFITQKK